MTENNTIPLISDQLLEDYADGRLDGKTERRVEALVSNDIALREKVLRIIAVREAVRADVAERAGLVSEETRHLVSQLEKRYASSGKKRSWKPVMAVAASLAIVLVGTGVWSQYGLPNNPIQQAAIQTLLSSSNVTKEDANRTANAGETDSTEAKTIKTTNEVANNDGQAQPMPEIVPDFTEFGFDLVETRAVAGRPETAVHLLYEGHGGRRVSLYYSGTDGDRKQQVTVRQVGPLAVLFWYADGRSFSMIGEVQRNDLVKLARKVTAGISLQEMQSDAENDGTNPQPNSSQKKSSADGTTADGTTMDLEQDGDTVDDDASSKI